MRIAVLILASFFALPALAADDDQTRLVLELQSAERLTAAALQVLDFPELEQQKAKSLDIAKRLLDQPNIDVVIPCNKASLALHEMIKGLIGASTAKSHLAYQENLVTFSVTMDICEERLGLPASEPPYFGRAPR